MKSKEDTPIFGKLAARFGLFFLYLAVNSFYLHYSLCAYLFLPIYFI
ncbi:hypothetical protein QE357_003964 [Siphonobacter sp. BAB-5404]|nr:hypothetical protein [Siphonobacter sp. SORGH_AS_0500]